MSTFIETATMQNELERTEKMNRIAENEEYQYATACSSLLQSIARRIQQNFADDTQRQIETELHEAEKHIRKKYNYATDLPSAAHPENSNEVHKHNAMRGLLHNVMTKK